MKLNNIWGYGQLFGYSGLDGQNRHYKDFIGTLTAEKIGVRFELPSPITIHFFVGNDVEFLAVTGDMIDAETKDGNVFLTFADMDTVVGCSPVLPVLQGDNWECCGGELWKNGSNTLSLEVKKEDDLYRFALHFSADDLKIKPREQEYLDIDIHALKRVRYAYYESMPVCRNQKYEQLYYKALSVNKVNVHTAEGQIPCMWTTPDRVPHRNMWLWDSVFHALAMVTYNKEAAKNALRAVLSQIHDDGFMPHMFSPTIHSKVTQPQVLAWGVWEIYKKTDDKEFLKESVSVLDSYLVWDMQNRDVNGNGLLEWYTVPTNLQCKCGESGLDNSPRFDFDEEMDAVDFSTFLARDALYLSYIYTELDDKKNSDKWKSVYETVKAKMNALLWDEETGTYYDRLFDGKLSKVLTPASFFPLFANIPSAEQAKKMVQTLTDPDLLWTEFPLATVAKNHSTYSTDMWRGGVWLNLNYFIIIGLKNYGYNVLAEELKYRTLDMVNKWYQRTGAIFEFYAPEGDVVPYACERKGKPTTPPDWRKHTHSIIDFNWSACFTLMLIQDELY